MTSTTSIDFGQVATQIVTAAQTHHWTSLMGLILMVVVYLVRRLNLVSQVPAKYVPWVTIVVSAAGAIATAIIGGKPLFDSLMSGLSVGFAAIASWELGGQHVLPTPAPAPVPTPTPTPAVDPVPPTSNPPSAPV